VVPIAGPPTPSLMTWHQPVTGSGCRRAEIELDVPQTNADGRVSPPVY